MNSGGEQEGRLHIGRAGPFDHPEDGRRVLAVGKVRDGDVQTCARWGDFVASGRRPDPAADDRLAADLAAALTARRDAGPAVRAGRDAWQQRGEAAS